MVPAAGPPGTRPSCSAATPGSSGRRASPTSRSGPGPVRAKRKTPGLQPPSGRGLTRLTSSLSCRSTTDEDIGTPRRHRCARSRPGHSPGPAAAARPAPPPMTTGPRPPGWNTSPMWSATRSAPAGAIDPHTPRLKGAPAHARVDDRLVRRYRTRMRAHCVPWPSRIPPAGSTPPPSAYVMDTNRRLNTVLRRCARDRLAGRPQRMHGSLPWRRWISAPPAGHRVRIPDPRIPPGPAGTGRSRSNRTPATMVQRPCAQLLGLRVCQTDR